MKTSEFIKRVEQLGYEVVDNINDTVVYRNDNIVAIVYNKKVNRLDTFWDEDVPHELFHVLFSYASTPIEERKEHKDIKKYHLYHHALNAYFNYHKIDEYYTWDTLTQTDEIQTEFTEEEIRNNKFRDIMGLLDKEEVKWREETKWNHLVKAI